MSKSLYLISFLILNSQNLWSQSTKDSVINRHNLPEVCVCYKTEETDQSFTFYRSNKLATTEDILARIQGVNLIKRGAYGLEPTIRGFGSGQTNLTIDGMRMYGACTDKMDPVSIYIEPINLKSISVKYGAEGSGEGSTLGGHIGMKLNEPKFNCHSNLKGQLMQSYLSVNNGLNSSIMLNQSFKKWAYRISGTFRKADNYKSGSNKEVQFSQFQKSNSSVSIIYNLKDSQQIKLDYLGDWGKNIGFPALPMDVGSATANIIAVTYRQNFKYSKYFNKNEFKVYANAITHSMDDTRRNDIPIHMDMPGWSKTIGLYNLLTCKKNLSIRLDFHRAYTRADMTMYPLNEAQMYMQTLPENNLNDLGIAINKEIFLSKKQQLTLLGRLDYFLQYANSGSGQQQWSVFNTDITIKQKDILKNISALYVINLFKQSQIKFNLGYSERIPTSNERYGYYLYNRQDQFDYLGNINLKPEQSLQSQVVLSQTYKNLEYSFQLFYHHIKQFIYAYTMNEFKQMTIGALGLKTYKNIDFAISTGFEGNLSLQLPKEFIYYSSVKYVYSKTFYNKPLPLVPPLKIQQALRFKKNNYQFQFEHDFASTQNRVNSDYGDRVTPSYHLYNFRVSKNFNFKNTQFQIALACENLFDITYREHLDIGTIPRFGRNFLINFNYLF